MEATMTRTNWGRAFGGGIVAGIVAGLVLAAYLVGMNVYEGKDIWLPIKGAGLPLLGERAAQPGFDLTAVAVGAGVHTGISIVWGLLFAMLFSGASRLGTVALGVVWGVVVWLVMHYLVLPMAGLTEMARSVPMREAVTSHIGFGVVLALAYLPFQRPRGDREPVVADRLDPAD
jgi:uncharacterized membrane protein YagU involved in acid resistance